MATGVRQKTGALWIYNYNVSGKSPPLRYASLARRTLTADMPMNGFSVLIVQAGFIGPLEKGNTHDLILVILTLEYIVVDMSNMCRTI